MNTGPKRKTAKTKPARRGRPRDDGRPPITRENIIKAASTIFGRSSIAGASVKDIANELECHTASIFHHFETKQDVIVAVAIDIFSAELKRFANLEALNAPPDVTLFRMIYDDAYYSGSGSGAVRSIFISPELRNGEFSELNEMMDEFLGRLKHLVKRGAQEKLFRSVNVDYTADCLNALGLVRAVSWSKDRAPSALKQLALTAARMGVGSLLRDTSRLPQIEKQALALKLQRRKRAA